MCGFHVSYLSYLTARYFAVGIYLCTFLFWSRSCPFVAEFYCLAVIWVYFDFPFVTPLRNFLWDSLLVLVCCTQVLVHRVCSYAVLSSSVNISEFMLFIGTCVVYMLDIVGNYKAPVALPRKLVVFLLSEISLHILTWSILFVILYVSCVISCPIPRWGILYIKSLCHNL